MKTAELTDELLDYWVALAEGYAPEKFGKRSVRMEKLNDGRTVCLVDPYPGVAAQWIGVEQGADSGAWLWSPSTNWAHGGPIIDRDGIGTSKDEFEPVWHAELEHPARPDGCQRSFARGPTSLIAAMRAKVASVYGDEVPDHGN